MRKAAPLLLALALVAFPAAAPADAPEHGVVHVPRRQGATAVQYGAELYAANCLSCHGSLGSGTARGPSLRTAGALAADFYLRIGAMPLGAPDEQPKRGRPAFSDREIDALVAYVASLGHGPAIPRPHPKRGSVSEGLRLFTEHCAGCHQVVAAGGYVTGAVVPPLDRATPTQVAEAVRMGPYLMPRFSPKAIPDRQLDSIVAYVLEAQHPDDRGGWALGHIGPVPEGLVTWLVAAALLVAVCAVIGERLRRA